MFFLRETAGRSDGIGNTVVGCPACQQKITKRPSTAMILVDDDGHARPDISKRLLTAAPPRHGAGLKESSTKNRKQHSPSAASS